jgi:hypothetical protein
MRDEKLSRIAGLVSAAVVATVTFAVAAHALQTITTPNAFTISYSLSSGGNSSSLTPPANIPTFVMGAETSFGNVGSSFMTVVKGQDNELVWNGLESNGGGVTTGSSPIAGTHIIYIDFVHCVDLEVTNATSFHVHLSAPICSGVGGATGRVTEIW